MNETRQVQLSGVGDILNAREQAEKFYSLIMDAAKRLTRSRTMLLDLSGRVQYVPSARAQYERLTAEQYRLDRTQTILKNYIEKILERLGALRTAQEQAEDDQMGWIVPVAVIGAIVVALAGIGAYIYAHVASVQRLESDTEQLDGLMKLVESGSMDPGAIETFIMSTRDWKSVLAQYAPYLLLGAGAVAGFYAYLQFRGK